MNFLHRQSVQIRNDHRKKLRGVTLVELLVVLVIIAIMFAMLLSAIQAARKAYENLERMVSKSQFIEQVSPTVLTKSSLLEERHC